jgi:hypothetical protein
MEATAEAGMTTPKAVLHALLLEVQEGLRKGRSVIHLPSSWARGWTLLQQAAQMKAAEVASVRDVDFGLLHADRRTVSGYAGVYQHPNGWTARGKDPTGVKASVHIGLYGTAEDAAFARYAFYREHNMPYGALEVELAELRANPSWAKVSDTWLRRLAIYQLANSKRPPVLLGLTDDDQRWLTTNPVSEPGFDDPMPAQEAP